MFLTVKQFKHICHQISTQTESIIWNLFYSGKEIEIHLGNFSSFLPWFPPFTTFGTFSKVIVLHSVRDHYLLCNIWALVECLAKIKRVKNARQVQGVCLDCIAWKELLGTPLHWCLMLLAIYMMEQRFRMTKKVFQESYIPVGGSHAVGISVTFFFF